MEWIDMYHLTSRLLKLSILQLLLKCLWEIQLVLRFLCSGKLQPVQNNLSVKYSIQQGCRVSYHINWVTTANYDTGSSNTTSLVHIQCKVMFNTGLVNAYSNTV